MLRQRTELADEQRASWDTDGFLVLPGFFSLDRIDRMNGLVERAWARRRQPDNPVVIDVIGGPLKGSRMYFRDAPDDSKGHPYKLNDLYLVSREVRDLVLDRDLMALLRSLLGCHEVAICNSLNFERGSQQAYHFDTYHMPGPCPDGLIVTSICLEDVHAAAGPVTYYPGSHKIPPYRFSHGGVHAVADEIAEARAYAMDEVRARGLEPQDFHGRAGDVLVWHEQLFHGGRSIEDPTLTRRSLVTHYWRTDEFVAPEGWKLKGRRGRRWLSRAHQPVPTT